MASITKLEHHSKRDAAYYSQRFRNRVFATLIPWIDAECERLNVTRKELAERMGKDPAQLSRLLNHPSNLTLDTISELLLPFAAEADPPQIFRFADRATTNYMHPLIARVTGMRVEAHKDSPIKPIKPTPTESGSTSSVQVKLLRENAVA